jgi:hypothetical protein
MAGIPFVIDLATFNDWNGVRIIGSTYYETSGSSIASAGDINGDGFADVIVGAPGAALSLYTDHAATVVFGRGIEDTPADSVIDMGSLNSTPVRDSASSLAVAITVLKGASRFRLRATSMATDLTM